MGELRFTILGCGSSGGVPRLGGHWGACDPDNPKNRRRRCSLLIEQETEGGTTRILIDTSPDMRAQLLDAQVGELDAVVYTHAHADHVHGLDDLRMIVFNMRERLQVWADVPTQKDLYARFGYAFVQPEGSSYPPILEMNTIDGPLRITGAGGTVSLTPFYAKHGGMDALGFRVRDFAYLPDVADLYADAWAHLEGLECWVLDALRRTTHPTHINLDTALEWFAKTGTKRGVLTNMHIDLDHATVQAETPDNVDAAFDGMVIRFPI